MSFQCVSIWRDLISSRRRCWWWWRWWLLLLLLLASSQTLHMPCHRHNGCGEENGNKRKISSTECQRVKLRNFLLIWCVCVDVWVSAAAPCSSSSSMRCDCEFYFSKMLWLSHLIVICRNAIGTWRIHPCRGDSSSVGSIRHQGARISSNSPEISSLTLWCAFCDCEQWRNGLG